jgi:hypothetical protein
MIVQSISLLAITNPGVRVEWGEVVGLSGFNTHPGNLATLTFVVPFYRSAGLFSGFSLSTSPQRPRNFGSTPTANASPLDIWWTCRS